MSTSPQLAASPPICSSSTLSPDSESGVGDSQTQLNTKPGKKDAKFWLIFISMCVCLSVSALELFSVSTALPTIAYALNSSQFAWIAASYALSSTAFLPISGSLAQIFGRQPIVLITLGLFALGSGICGGASTMNMFIAGRIIQGLGGGGIQSLTGIVLGDLVTLQERGVYAGLYGLTWCLAASIGPLVGGSLAEQGQWRWIFYLNLPISFIACLLVVVLLDLPIPKGSSREKIMQMDWIGSFLVISSTTACTIGFTWGGLTAPWNSFTVLVPLVLGFVGLVVFVMYEATYARHPLVPFSILTNMTCISGYIQTFCNTIITFAIVYFFPIYFQGCKGDSPVASGVKTLAFASLAPAAIVTGLSVKASGRYRVQMWMSWMMIVVALGLMSTLRATDALGKSIGYLVLLGFGIGIMHATPMYPIQAPLPVEQNAVGISFMWFLRSFAAIWGITIGTTVLQNELSKRLPASFTNSFPQGTVVSIYELIPQLNHLSANLRFEVEVAFGGSLATLWKVMAAIGGLGLLTSLFMKEIPLHTTVDEDWTLKNKGTLG